MSFSNCLKCSAANAAATVAATSTKYNNNTKNKKSSSKKTNDNRKSKACSCHVAEMKFHALEHDKNSQSEIETLLHKNTVGEYALHQHKLGVRNTTVQHLAKQYQDKTFFRTTDEKEQLESLYEERQKIRQMFDEVLRRLDSNGSFEQSLQIEELLEQSVFKVLVQSSVRSPINVENVRSTSRSSGSGFLVDKAQRYIVTNGHVIRNADLILIESAGNVEMRFKAKVAKVSFDLDIAILQIENIGNQFQKFDNADYKALKLCRAQDRFIEKIVKLKKENCSSARLTRVYAVGYPLGSSTFQISSGVISGFEGISDEPVIQITAPISHGSSGGALLNVNGEVIGVTSSGIPIGENIGFAIPIQFVINVLNALKNNVTANRIVLKLPYLGLNFQKNTRNQRFPVVQSANNERIQIIIRNNKPVLTAPGQEGVLIVRVDKNSIFLNPVGGDRKRVRVFDRLIELNGFKIDDFGNTGTDTYPRNMPVKFIFRSLPFGEQFTAVFIRNGVKYTNIYTFNPIKPEEDLPIRSLTKEELMHNEELREEFSPFTLHDQLTLVRLNSDFISLVGDSLPELQQYKETSLIKEPLLILLNDKRGFITKPEIVDTINGEEVHTKQDALEFEEEPSLIVETRKGNVTYSVKPEKSQELDFEMFKKLFLKK